MTTHTATDEGHPIRPRHWRVEWTVLIALLVATIAETVAIYRMDANLFPVLGATPWSPAIEYVRFICMGILATISTMIIASAVAMQRINLRWNICALAGSDMLAATAITWLWIANELMHD